MLKSKHLNFKAFIIISCSVVCMSFGNIHTVSLNFGRGFGTTHGSYFKTYSTVPPWMTRLD